MPRIPKPTLLSSLRRLLAACLLLGAPTALAKWELRVCLDPNQLPFSDRAGGGFDNRIAQLLADELGAELVPVWASFEALDYVRNDLLHTGRCDAVIGLEDGTEGVLTTVAYYRSPYAFVVTEASQLELATLDDPVLAGLRLGVSKAGIAPHHVLLGNGLRPNLTVIEPGDYDDPSYLAAPVRAVAEGRVDATVVWGPVAGYFARSSPVPLRVTPVTPEVYLPHLLMVHSMVIGVRPGDESLRDLLNEALTSRWDEVRAILADHGVPTTPLPAPTRVTTPASAAPVHNVGLVVPMTTSLRTELREVAGQAAVLGARLAEDRPPEQASITLDVLLASAPNADAARRAAHRLIERQGVRVLIGGVGDDQAHALARVAAEAGVLFLNIGSSDQALRASPPATTFHVEASDEMYLRALLGHHATQGTTIWAVLYPDTPEGQRWRDLVADLGGPHGSAAVVEALAVAADQVAFTSEITRLLASEAQGVLALLPPRQQEFLLSQLQMFGAHKTVATLPHPLSQTRQALAALSAVGGEASAHTRVALWETTLSDPEASDLIDRFVSRWGRPMDPSAWAAYAAVEIARAALEELPSDPVAHLASGAAAFAVHKGDPATFDPTTRQLAQPLYVIELVAGTRYDPTLAGLTALARYLGVAP